VGAHRKRISGPAVPGGRPRSPAVAPGTGVGLASVRQVMEHHGGQVESEGADCNGATFYFTLPTEEST
jgi:signal transduction histidine kinase